ncbi:MAG: hypothetical protein EPO55_03280 [Reyranella sp.]|uniref:hypothetical protein n=1 Tax=Reyranella sp. TaxID=1929291 RepID=UPI0012147472|nr:hypothetical protein [Reyranella sp.]TAJ42065.1 MAG: hypothetical protein EPO55_03280 [Reyranella sp.]
MPLRWKTLQAERLIHIVAEGKVTLKEIEEEYFDALVVADVLASAKLYDATLAEPVYSDDDVMTMGRGSAPIPPPCRAGRSPSWG